MAHITVSTMDESPSDRDNLKKVADGVFALVNQIDDECPATTSVYNMLSSLQQQLDPLLTIRGAFPDTLYPALEALSKALRESKHNITERTTKSQVRKIGQRLGEDYERLVAAIRSQQSLEEFGHALHTLRPRNYYRNFFHIFNAFLSVFCYEFLITRFEAALVLFLVFAWYMSMDILRRIWPEAEQWLFDRLLKAITRPRERYIIPAATWYCLGIFYALVVARKCFAQTAVLVLGVGDPSATLIGKRYGTVKLYRQKSYAGFAGFFLSSFTVVLAYLTLSESCDFPTSTNVCIAFVAAVTGALAELFSNDRFDDNLTVPVTVSSILSLVFWAL